jgi:hypothetical protein
MMFKASTLALGLALGMFASRGTLAQEVPSGNLRGDAERDLQNINVRIDMCHLGQTVSVLAHEIEAHLSHGDTLGACDDPSTHIREILAGLGETAIGFGTGDLDLAGAGVLSSADTTVVGAVRLDLASISGADIIRHGEILGLTWLDIPSSDLSPGYYGFKPRYQGGSADGTPRQVVVDIIDAKSGKVADTVVPEVWDDTTDSGERGTMFFGEIIPDNFDSTVPAQPQGRRKLARRWTVSIWIGGRRWRVCIIIGNSTI